MCYTCAHAVGFIIPLYQRSGAALGLTPPPGEEAAAEAPAEVRALAENRWAARTAKDWAAADTLRAELAAHGWSMKDGKETYTLAPAQD